MGCCCSGFQRTKISNGASPSKILIKRLRRFSTAARRSCAPSTPALISSFWRLIQSPKYYT
jgi:hypothetical protein